MPVSMATVLQQTPHMLYYERCANFSMFSLCTKLSEIAINSKNVTDYLHSTLSLTKCTSLLGLTDEVIINELSIYLRHNSCICNLQVIYAYMNLISHEIKKGNYKTMKPLLKIFMY